MCTSIVLRKGGYFFGRNLDMDRHFGEKVVIMPKNYAFPFRNVSDNSRFALVGMASLLDGVPLFADAMNEKGLAMAGLNFPGNAFYKKTGSGIAPWELIPFLLRNFATVREVRKALTQVALIDEVFREGIPNAPLHYHISDREESVVLESTREGVRIYDNPFDVMTNNPPFPFHRENMRQYSALSPVTPEGVNAFGEGFGGIGLPGDYSPASRFVKAAYLVKNQIASESDMGGANQFFHIAGNVEMPKGSVITKSGTLDYTIYASVMSGETGTYYFKTYEDMAVRKVSLADQDGEGKDLFVVAV